MDLDLANQRQEYDLDSIDVESVDPCPFRQFEVWFRQATDRKILEPNAMVLSTVDKRGQPSQRSVLLKYFDTSGFVFFTNYKSRKAQQMEGNQRVSLLFPWYALQRQVEIHGVATKTTMAESLKYFSSRPRGSQLGAWVSQQSQVVSSRSVIMNKLAELTQKFAKGDIPLPSFWGGFRIVPDRMEFWQGGLQRLHDRIEYRLLDDQWVRQRLAP